MKIGKFLLGTVAAGVALGGAFLYLKDKGYINVNGKPNTDEDFDDLDDLDALEGFDEESCCEGCCSDSPRTYVYVDTKALKEKATEIAHDVKGKAGSLYEDAKKIAGTATDSMAHAVEKAWYSADSSKTAEDEEVTEEVPTSEEVEETVVDEFFNDEETQ